MNRLAANIVAFLGMALFIILVILSFFVFSYLVIIGAIIGLILFVIAFFRARFASTDKPIDNQSHSTGRTIEYDDINKDN